MTMRATKLVALAAAAALLLSGCSLLSTVQHELGAAASNNATPVAGDCWAGKFASIAYWATWRGSAPISCDLPHQSYTFAVGQLPNFSATTWADTNGYLNASIGSAASQACEELGAKFLPTLTPSQELIHRAFYLPSLSSWAKGARWVRCDVAEYEFGSLLKTPTLTYLPSKISVLQASLRSDPGEYGLCSNVDSGPNGDLPLDATARFANCEDHPDWALKAITDIPNLHTEGAAYPGKKSINAFGTKKCLGAYVDKHDRAYYYFPTSAAWGSGDRTIKCWVQNY